MPQNYSDHQKKIIKRYYENEGAIGYQRLAELTTEIYLAEGKKLDRLWKQAAADLAKLKLSQQRIDHLLEKRDPKLLAEVVKEFTGKV